MAGLVDWALGRWSTGVSIQAEHFSVPRPNENKSSDTISSLGRASRFRLGDNFFIQY